MSLLRRASRMRWGRQEGRKEGRREGGREGGREGRRVYLLVEEVEIVLVEEVGEKLAGEAVEGGLNRDIKAPGEGGREGRGRHEL